MIKFGASMLSWIPLWITDHSRGMLCHKGSGREISNKSNPFSAAFPDFRDLNKELLTRGTGRFTFIIPEYHLSFYSGKALNHLKAVLGIVEEAGDKFFSGVWYASIGVFTGKSCTKEEWQILKDILLEFAARDSKKIMFALEPIHMHETNVITSAREVLDLASEIAGSNLDLYKPVMTSGKAGRHGLIP